MGEVGVWGEGAVGIRVIECAGGVKSEADVPDHTT